VACVKRGGRTDGGISDSQDFRLIPVIALTLYASIPTKQNKSFFTSSYDSFIHVIIIMDLRKVLTPLTVA
jgi:hypothetical protein